LPFDTPIGRVLKRFKYYAFSLTYQIGPLRVAAILLAAETALPLRASGRIWRLFLADAGLFDPRNLSSYNAQKKYF
jgi:hypothetical protein